MTPTIVYEWMHPAAAAGEVAHPLRPYLLFVAPLIAIAAYYARSNPVESGLLVASAVVMVIWPRRVRRRAMQFRIGITTDRALLVVDRHLWQLNLRRVQSVDVVVGARAPVDTSRHLRLTHTDGVAEVKLPGHIEYFFGGPVLTSDHIRPLLAALRHHAGLGAPAPGPWPDRLHITPDHVLELRRPLGDTVRIPLAGAADIRVRLRGDPTGHGLRWVVQMVDHHGATVDAPIPQGLHDGAMTEAQAAMVERTLREHAALPPD